MSEGRILVVDDDFLIRESLSELLRLEGYEVDIAPGGQEALAALGSRTYDLVFTDYRMPDMSGIEVLERLRKGVWLSEGRTGSIDVKILRETRRDTVLKLTIKEGKNRIVRRVMAKLGLRVTELERTRIGSVALGKLKPGSYRPLNRAEVKRLIGSGKGGKKHKR